VRFKRIGAFSICLTGCLIALPAQAALCEQADVVVYGGTPGGVTAATQAARLKKDVILLEPTMHIGGMMANGLSKADVSPRTGVYGGLAAAFFRRMKAHYNQTDPYVVIMNRNLPNRRSI
jgi:ribulose 1,5-bisphosphate synthetase/thiazole synthase